MHGGCTTDRRWVARDGAVYLSYLFYRFVIDNNFDFFFFYFIIVVTVKDVWSIVNGIGMYRLLAYCLFYVFDGETY